MCDYLLTVASHRVVQVPFTYMVMSAIATGGAITSTLQQDKNAGKNVQDEDVSLL